MKKSALCLSMLLLLSFQLSLTAFAKDNTAPIGGLTPEEEKQTNEEIIQEVVNDQTISDEAKASVIEKTAFVEGKKIQTRTIYDAAEISYKLIMQEDNTKCAPATIQQSLYVCSINHSKNYPYGSQTAIQNAVGKAPGLSTVLNYLNQQQDKVHFIRKRVYSIADIDSCYEWGFNVHSSPVILTFAADTSFWPYNTPGHFTNIMGYSHNNYIIADPYYYVKYVPSSKGNEGRNVRLKSDVWKANTKLFGEGNNTIGY